MSYEGLQVFRAMLILLVMGTAALYLLATFAWHWLSDLPARMRRWPRERRTIGYAPPTKGAVIDLESARVTFELKRRGWKG